MALSAESGLSPSVPEDGAPHRCGRRENFSGVVPARTLHPGHPVPYIYAGRRSEMTATEADFPAGATIDTPKSRARLLSKRVRL